MWTTAQLRAKGVSKRQLNSFLRIRRGVYAAPECCAHTRDAALHGGALACVSAAEHLGIWVLTHSADAHVWLGGHGHAYPHPGCACIEHWDGSPTDAFGLASVARMLRQILDCRGVEEFFVALESARHLHLITDSGMAWLRAHTNPAARESIDFARADAESGLESLMRWRLRDLDIEIRCQVEIAGVGRVDLLLGDRLIVEVDGVLGHDGASSRHKDLVRDSNAAAWGYLTLRFDYAMIVHDWPSVEATVRSYVDRGLHRA